MKKEYLTIDRKSNSKIREAAECAVKLGPPLLIQ